MDYQTMDRVEQVVKVHVYTLVNGRVMSKLLPKAVLPNDHPATPLRCAHVIDEDNVTRCLLKNYDAGTFEKPKEKEQIDEHRVTKKKGRKSKCKRMAIRRFFEAKANADKAESTLVDECSKLRKWDHEISIKEKNPQNYPVANDLDPDFVRGIKCSCCGRFLVSSTMICQQNHPICLVCAKLAHYPCFSSNNGPKCDDVSHYKCILCNGPLAVTDEYTKIMKLCRFRCTEESCEQKNIILNYEDFVQHTLECKLKFLATV